MTLILYPFAKKGTKTLIHSWLVSLKPHQEMRLISSKIRALSAHLGCHENTLKRQLSILEPCAYYFLTKIGSGWTVKRTGKKVPYQGVSMDVSVLSDAEKASFKSLSPAETVLYGAISCLTLQKKTIPPRFKLALMTGFSLRQVTNALSSLWSKGWLKQTRQHEDYVRHTQAEGRGADTRLRTTYLGIKTFFLKILTNFAPLKDKLKTPVKNVFKLKSDLKKLVDYFDEKTGQTTKNLGWIEKVLKKRGLFWCLEEVQHKIDAVLANPFYRLAAKFGWQEAVIESYHRQNKQIWVSSRHINNYTQKKLDFGWVVRRLSI